MYQLLIQKDLDLVEINPLGVSASHEVMALDGKIAVNDHALGRQSELANLASSLTHTPQPADQPTDLQWTDSQGNIGILCNSPCLAAATLDLVYKAKGKPASCLIVDGYASWDVPSAASPVQQLQNALQQLTDTQNIQVVLVNILSNAAASEAVAEVIANYLLQKGNHNSGVSAADSGKTPTTGKLHSRNSRDRRRNLTSKSASRTDMPHLVIRLVNGKIDSSQNRLAALPVHWMDTLDQAVAQAISLARS
jgi:succinyl-CoA synthetase beta subunit